MANMFLLYWKFSTDLFQISTILTNPNTTDAIDDLCAKDWVIFLNLPGKVGVNFTALQEEFCALNFTAFLPELYKEFGLQEIMDKVCEMF